MGANRLPSMKKLMGDAWDKSADKKMTEGFAKLRKLLISQDVRNVGEVKNENKRVNKPRKK